MSNTIDFRLHLIDDMSKEVVRVKKLTESSLHKMTVEQKKYTAAITKTKLEMLKLEKESLSASKERQKQIRDEIRLLRQRSQVERQGLTAANRANRANISGRSGGIGGLGVGGSLLPVLGGVAAAAAFIKLAADTAVAAVKVKAEFEKFEAVLANTLGDRSEAKKALIDIQEFASKTPFQVDELTDSFVKLANRGFKPTMSEMTKLGDLASSTGKSFDQLTEAVLDAQTMEFERLKEFGIKGSKVKGKNLVEFTFKGVTTQVKASDEAIKNYILSLGELNGVMGSMAAISETTTGKISNLSDKWDMFLLGIGTLIKPTTDAVLDFAGAVLDVFTYTEKYSDSLREEQLELNSLVTAITTVNEKDDARLALLKELNLKYPEFLRNLDKENVSNKELADRLKEINEEYNRKIFFASYEEELTDITKQQTAAFKEKMDLVKQATKIAKESGYEIKGEGLGISDIINQIITFGEERGMTGTMYGLDQILKLNEAYKAADEKYNTLGQARENIIQLYKEYGVGTVDFSTESSGPSTSGGSGGSGNDTETAFDRLKTATEADLIYNKGKITTPEDTYRYNELSKKIYSTLDIIKDLGLETASGIAEKMRLGDLIDELKDLAEGKGKFSNVDSSTELNSIASRSVQNITLTVQKMVGVENMSTTNIRESSAQVGAAMNKLLQKALLDVSIASRFNK